jgi:hypothetical protein
VRGEESLSLSPINTSIDDVGDNPSGFMDIGDGFEEETRPNGGVNTISEEEMFNLIQEGLSLMVVDLPTRESGILPQLG